MKRSDLETYLGKWVWLELFDHEELEGYLRSTQDPIFRDNLNLSLKKNYYVVTGDVRGRDIRGCLFRTSHVRKIKESR